MTLCYVTSHPVTIVQAEIVADDDPRLDNPALTYYGRIKAPDGKLYHAMATPEAINARSRALLAFADQRADLDYRNDPSYWWRRKK